MKIKLSKSQWQFIGNKTGWIKKAQVEQPQGSNLVIKAAESMLWEINRHNKMGGSKLTLNDLLELGEVGDVQATGKAFELLRSKNFINIEKAPGSEGISDARNLISITNEGQAFLNKRINQPESLNYGDVEKHYKNAKKMGWFKKSQDGIKETSERVICDSGIEGWQDKLQNIYDSMEEFIHYDEVYGLCKRLGYDDPEKCWQENPTIQGSVNPEDLKNVTKELPAECSICGGKGYIEDYENKWKCKACQKG